MERHDRINYFAYVKDDKIVSRITTYTINDGSHLHIGIAYCSPRNQFCRKIGRDIALGRAIKKHKTDVIDSPIPGDKVAELAFLAGLVAEFGSKNISFMKGATRYDIRQWCMVKGE
jgi:hypothetical protein